ncbi:hypothetical protein AncyloWKF20_10530 [Ancylobacter sp. WKF20]|nr:hypothetical protein [Ancylobacter sp. WKF20]WGD32220.1 hypothetical protein AncyloWKF20_10530 [Ancylobacter sp. WKF20]
MPAPEGIPPIQMWAALRSRNRLFIAATTSLYAVHVNARGAQTP